MTDLETQAKQLYDDCWTVKPEWKQLGDVTKQYWMDRAERVSLDNDPAP